MLPLHANAKVCDGWLFPSPLRHFSYTLKTVSPAQAGVHGTYEQRCYGPPPRAALARGRRGCALEPIPTPAPPTVYNAAPRPGNGKRADLRLL